VRYRRRNLRVRYTGRSRFQLLQNALNKKAKLLYVVFDTLFVDGEDIRQKPLLERKEILKRICRAIRYFATASTSPNLVSTSSPKPSDLVKKA